MWTSRNLVALGLFLFGTTLWWMTAAVVSGIAGLVAVVPFVVPAGAQAAGQLAAVTLAGFRARAAT
jgi:apolipoprotein N-acyltransferase